MALTSLLEATKIASGTNASMSIAVGKPELDSSVNTIKIMNTIARVYAACAKYFVGLDMSAHDEKIKELMKNGTALELVSIMGKVNDADAVSVLEALKWTSSVVLSEGEQKPRIRLALIAPSEDKGEKDGINVELSAKANNSLWNSFVLESTDTSDMKYSEVFPIMQNGPKYVNIYQLSNNLYDVTLS